MDISQQNIQDRVFLSTLASFPGTFPKRFLEKRFCEEPVSVCFYRQELHSTRYLKIFPEF